MRAVPAGCRCDTGDMTTSIVTAGPDGQVRVPDAVLRLAAGGPLRLVWRSKLGGQTYETVTPRATRVFVKWVPAHAPVDLIGEAERLEWAGRWAAVPKALDYGSDPEGSWLVTCGLPGASAVGPDWQQRPGIAVRALGQGLRALHEMLPVDRCPFTWSVPERLAAARTGGKTSPAEWHEDHRWLTFEDAWQLLENPPPIDRLVVCHGDPCVPNGLLNQDGAFVGHVDLGNLGIADRWADLAVATWSLEWNYGPGWEPLFLRSYGVEPDADRLRYYRVLYDLEG